MKQLIRKPWFLLSAGMVLGAVILLVIRFATYHVTQVHYHANFAVYLNGQREEFKGPQYYQEVAACQVNGPIQPAQRAHMHSNINSVIHVHDDGVTWNQFFQNLGWNLGSNFIQTDAGTMYLESGDAKLHIVLNGQDLTDLTSISNVVIRDRDRLLISFGSIDNQTLQTEYQSVPSTAKYYDESTDPASCSGNIQKTTWQDRLHHLF